MRKGNGIQLEEGLRRDIEINKYQLRHFSPSFFLPPLDNAGGGGGMLDAEINADSIYNSKVCDVRVH